MTDRICARGCTVPDVHYATCPDFGKDEGDCKGCAPREARDGALICERCYRTLRRCLEDAGDVVGLIRSIADPSKAARYDAVRVQSSRPDLPAPVAADLVDASDDIVRVLRMWEMHVAGEVVPDSVPGLPAGTWAGEAHTIAQSAADAVLEVLDELVNDRDEVLALCAGVIERHTESSPAVWSLADALTRWSFEDRPRWAEAPCPDCDMKTVRVQPPRRRGTASRYACTSCGWLANSDDDGGLWAAHFREEVPLGEGAPHEPRWLTLAAAARHARVTTGTMRRWAEKGLVGTKDGRYWQPDIDEKTKEAA